jgi:hypothetical protein
MPAAADPDLPAALPATKSAHALAVPGRSRPGWKKGWETGGRRIASRNCCRDPKTARLPVFLPPSCGRMGDAGCHDERAVGCGLIAQRRYRDAAAHAPDPSRMSGAHPLPREVDADYGEGGKGVNEIVGGQRSMCGEGWRGHSSGETALPGRSAFRQGWMATRGWEADRRVLGGCAENCPSLGQRASAATPVHLWSSPERTSDSESRHPSTLRGQRSNHSVSMKWSLARIIDEISL